MRNGKKSLKKASVLLTTFLLVVMCLAVDTTSVSAAKDVYKRQPMTSILGYADTLLTVRLQRQQQERALSYISSECRRLSRLSVKMLELTGLYETGEARFAPTENSVKAFLEDSRPVSYTHLDVYKRQV